MGLVGGVTIYASPRRGAKSQQGYTISFESRRPQKQTNKQRRKINLVFLFRPVRVIRFISEETIEEGIYSIAQEKLKLEQDLVNSDEDPEKVNDSKRVKKDVSRLLKLALDVDISENQIGDVKQVYTDEGGKTFAEL